MCTPAMVLLHVLRYNEAKDVAKNLEKQASKVQAEAEEAGDKALKIFANLTSLPPLNTDALEVTSGRTLLHTGACTHRCFSGAHGSCGSRLTPVRSRRRRRTWTN